MSILKEKYEGKKVFITGHTGFKGSWLIYWLHLLGAEVKAYSLEAEPRSLYNDLKGDQLCDSVIADIRDAARLQKEVADFQPDFVFHLAAQSLVRPSYRSPLYTFEVNTLGTANVLEALKGVNKQCSVVIITTDKVYENQEVMRPYEEGDRLGGYDPYSASKACAELVTQSFRNSFFNVNELGIHQTAIATARAGNVIGGGDWAEDRLIPDIVRALDEDRSVIIRNPAAIRPWQHVLEPLYGYLLLGIKLAEKPLAYSEGWNFGPDIKDNLTVREVLDNALKVWGSGAYTIEPTGDNFHEAKLLMLNVRKAYEQLGWTPVFSAQQAIEKTIGWYQKYLIEGQSAAALVEADIEAYSQVMVEV